MHSAVEPLVRSNSGHHQNIQQRPTGLVHKVVVGIVIIFMGNIFFEDKQQREARGYEGVEVGLTPLKGKRKTRERERETRKWFPPQHHR